MPAIDKRRVLSSMASMPLTLSQMVAILTPLSPEPPATLNRQIRSWTDAGALPLVGGLRTGTGRGRLYDESAPKLAAVAIELTRFGLPIGVIHDALVWMNHDFRHQPSSPLTKLERREIKLYMVVMAGERGRDFSYFYAGQEDLLELISSDLVLNKSTLVVNIPALWAAVEDLS